MREDDPDQRFIVFIKKYSFPAIFALLNLTWLVFCIIPQYIELGTTTVYDFLNQSEVSNQYELIIPVIRYIFEPFFALSFQFSRNALNWLWIILIIVAVLFILTIIIDKWTYKGAMRNNRLIQELRIALNFFITTIIISVLTITIRLFVLYPEHGMEYVISSYVKPIKIASMVCLSIFIIKFMHGLITMKTKGRDFKTNKIYVKISQWFYIFTKFENGFIRNLFKTLTEVYRYLRTSILFVAILFAISSVNLPSQRILHDLDSDEILLDFGIQTDESTGFMPVKARIDWYLNQGINGAAFTDYYTNKSFQEAQDYISEKNLNFKLISAEKYKTDGVLLNIYGVNETISGRNLSETIQYVKNKGGYVIVNNYVKNESALYTYNELLNWGIDGFCITYRGVNLTSEIRQYCLDNSLICLGGSDIIGNEPVHTFVKLKLSDPTNTSIDAIFSDLSSNSHQICVIQKDSSLQVGNRAIDDFLAYIANLDVNQATSWGMWSVFVYVLCQYVVKKSIKSGVYSS